jgi:hypothetical protein
MRKFIPALFFALWLAAGDASATPQTPMQFRIFEPCRGSASFCGPRILASGVIESNSHVKLAAFIAKASKDDLPPLPTIVFDSPGGSVSGGIELGRFIRKRGFDTVLEKDVEEEYRVGGFNGGTDLHKIATNTICASACSLAFLGGRARAITPGARLGVHQFYAAEGNIGDGATQVTMTRLALYVEEMGVDRRLLDFASSAGPSGMHWIDDRLARELRVDNTRPLLADWRIDADNQGVPSLAVRQPVAPNRELILVMHNGARAVTIAVLVIIAKDAPGSFRQSAFPVGDPVNIEFISNEKTIAKATPGLDWTRARNNPDGSVVFGGSASISFADLQRLSTVRQLEIRDDFAGAIYDLGISTPLSTNNLAGGAGLLLRTRGAR